MRVVAIGVLMAAIVGVTGNVALAHEVTYKGTVISVETTGLHVSVIDDATKKTSPMVFTVTKKTKVFRGDKAVSFVQARIQNDERIAVTINHDEPGQTATEIRLAPAK